MAESTPKIQRILATKRALLQKQQDDREQERNVQCSYLENRLRNLLSNPISESEVIWSTFNDKYFPNDCENVKRFVNEHNNLPNGQLKFVLFDISKKVNFISTDVNTKTDTITYTIC